jgi:hypothetical protein
MKLSRKRDTYDAMLLVISTPPFWRRWACYLLHHQETEFVEHLPVRVHCECGRHWSLDRSDKTL